MSFEYEGQIKISDHNTEQSLRNYEQINPLLTNVENMVSS